MTDHPMLIVTPPVTSLEELRPQIPERGLLSRAVREHAVDDHIDTVAGTIFYLHISRRPSGTDRDPLTLLRTNIGYQVNKTVVSGRGQIEWPICDRTGAVTYWADLFVVGPERSGTEL